MIRNQVTPTVRADLCAALGTGLEQLDPPLPDRLLPEVRPVQRVVTGDLPQPVVDVGLEELTPAGSGGQRRTHQLQVDVISDRQADADDDLDALLSAVLDVLGELGVVWATATRVTRDQHPAYRITLTLESTP